MNPLAFSLLFFLGLLWLVVLLLKIPSLLIGLLLPPLLHRFPVVVEFLYPLSIGRWLHLWAIRLGRKSSKPNDKSYGYHTRCLEARFEVIPNRLYIHILPQLLDNLGYLIVCLPPNDGGKILALVVDCGDAQAVTRQTALIANLHYSRQKIVIQAILSTHKHHDHTAGNAGLVADMNVPTVFGGAVERVPCCNFPLQNGNKLPLPQMGANDMGALVEIEAVATPGHTRGSMAYVLRVLQPQSSTSASLLFTGDMIFSGGGGVPFEADLDKNQEMTRKMNGNSYIKASAATYAVERCFAEILYRSVSLARLQETTSDEIVVFPGHEYTYELLQRQLSQSTESCRWKMFAPNYFFSTISHMFVAMHRRSLPLNNGKLLVAPSPMSREMNINPHLRSLKKRGELVVSAILRWDRHFAKRPLRGSNLRGGYGSNGTQRYTRARQTRSTTDQWNFDAQTLNQRVFTTVYSEDLEQVIAELDNGSLDPPTAAARLRALPHRLNLPVVGRRPIPGTLPSDQNIFKGLVGLALLGSSPSALKPSDAAAMRLPDPVGDNSDEIMVSRRRLIAVLYWLGLLTEEMDGKRVVAMIGNLWSEASDYERSLTMDETEDDVESTTGVPDTIELGSLKWILYGVPPLRPSCMPKFCSPCYQPEPALPKSVLKKHPIRSSGMQQDRGELVRHDIFSCLLCKGATGCTHQQPTENYGSASVEASGQHQLIIGNANDEVEEDSNDDESAYIEVTAESMGSVIID